MSSSLTTTPDLPAASGLTGQTTELPSPGEYPYLDVETQVPIIIAVTSAFLALSTLLVAARLYTRYGLIKVAGEDDITIGVAQVCTFASSKVHFSDLDIQANTGLAAYQHWSGYDSDTTYVHLTSFR